MRNKLFKVRKTVGKRGLACLAFAIAFIAIGLSYVFDTPSPIALMNLHFLTNVLPLKVWGILWVVGGATFLVGAFIKKLQLIAFLVGSAITLNWTIGYLIQAAFGESSRGYVSVVTYGIFAFFILLISSWSEPIELEKDEDKDG